MYYKINPTGCGEKNGLVQVRFDCYLEPADAGYSEHHVTVPVIPSGGYTGKKNEFGIPVDMEAHNKWLASLPTETRDNPFCCHFRCFEPDATDDDLIATGKEILKMAYDNNKAGTLQKNINPKMEQTTNIVKIQASLNRVETIKQTIYPAFKVTDNKGK